MSHGDDDIRLPRPLLAPNREDKPRVLTAASLRLARLMQRADLVEVDDAVQASVDATVAPSLELMRVTHRIANQFLDVIKMAARQLLGGHDVDTAGHQLASALDALGRLARAASDARHVELLAQMRADLERYEDDREHDRGEARFRDALRAWLPAYADHVGGSSGDALRDLVECDVDAFDVYRHLISLRGIGPRRLARLYAAGLYTADAIRGADAEEMAQVTGLPRRLAHTVVRAAQGHFDQQARDAVLGMPARLDRFLAEVGRLDPRTQEDEIAAAAEAARKMRHVLVALGGLDVVA